ncbi:GNAT family N-acetyltransferase [Flavivirga sp. 57AJ16]|uniref:GNAT family N-acetyltransferase n=1 Tax=Flavivirga sp. 57AJ16 TaxID=3025307 RepID=UPI0023665764|nr:GNAT family N-acetyltransferase [Flavivirga sp. 57AJ16]MDD7886756.1 GNAT family N-acetyltransferase [Flavivirga sp. 57AJ16]
MEIKNCGTDDIDEIFRLYKIARDFQKTKFTMHWPKFDRKLIITEISENRQWKLLIDNQVACVWATTFDDAQIWEGRNNDPSVYIHRIATNPSFRGQNLVRELLKWAKKFAIENDKKYIRMDTVGNNPGLIKYYEKCGFDFLGLVKLKNTNGLPAPYKNSSIGLFQATTDSSK